MSESTDGPDKDHLRPEGADDDTIAAVGKVSEALEYVERARGHLYELHQLIGHADLLLDEAVQELRGSGHAEHADRLATELIGRNVLAGRWTFQIVEDFDDNYWTAFREEERTIRNALQDGKRHVFESEMKEKRRTHGHPRHDSRP
ncbi:hypothetical protein DK926_04640 [Rhodococcus sp. Eu-32]|uniref:hypothetical protein n=1 Tax=Rhodococcus sp. Eu-32 TaxID=1017319 RepID=UPI000DF1B68C|nr:hypothetical protein [Rhodococcus sp. Eu-32]RRQ29174.1 hypothetical protein DK926_04640 [Rhodococcus sp. Eu-32]